MRLLNALALIVPIVALALPARAQDPEAIARGKYVFGIAGCAACHTDEANKGPLLAGGRELKTPFGVFYSPNITPDPQTGIGTWSEADFVRALHEGRGPDGSHFFPVFPYTSYTRMTESDMRDLKAYIFSLPPVVRENRPHDVSPPFGWRFLMTFWKWMFFEPGAFEPNPDRDADWNRGAYLANALGHCGECHTPRNALGAVETDMAFAGTNEGPEGGSVPNITPDPETGIGGWSESDLDTFFTLGMTPDGDFAGSGMAEVITNGTSKLTAEDRAALIGYLKALPPIGNKIGGSPES